MEERRPRYVPVRKHDTRTAKQQSRTAVSNSSQQSRAYEPVHILAFSLPSESW